MKNFFGEFKKFIPRGNVLDMSVGVIVGGAFTAIVNGLSNFVLKPLINYFLFLLLGKDSLSSIYTFLGDIVYTLDADGKPVLDELGNKIPDLKNCFYIDWGSLISAIINFLITAFVLFLIVKTMNNLKDGNAKQLKAGKAAKADRKAMKAQGIKRKDKEAVKAYFEAKAAKEAADKAAAEEKAKQDRLANPTTEDLLKEIRDLLKNNA